MQSLNCLVFDAMPPVQFLAQMLSESGAKIYLVKNDDSLEFTVQAFSYKIHNELNCNLKTEKGLYTVKNLLNSVDIVIESFRPGVMERLGLGPSDVHAINPNIVYVRLSGYG